MHRAQIQQTVIRAIDDIPLVIIAQGWLGAILVLGGYSDTTC